MGRRQLVQITGGLAEAGGQEEVLVVGQEVWDEWVGQAVSGVSVEDTDWRNRAKEE